MISSFPRSCVVTHAAANGEHGMHPHAGAWERGKTAYAEIKSHRMKTFERELRGFKGS